MNKYLKRYSEIVEELEIEQQENNFKLGEDGYEILEKMLIAEELRELRTYNNNLFDMFDEQEEKFIEILFKLMRENQETSSKSVRQCVEALHFAMESYDTWENFIDIYKNDYAELKDNFAWGLDGKYFY